MTVVKRRFRIRAVRRPTLDARTIRHLDSVEPRRDPRIRGTRQCGRGDDLLTTEQLDAVFEVLRGSHLLKSASDDGLRDLAGHTTIRTYRSGELVVREGEPADECGFILDGSVPSYQLSADGHHLLFKAGERGDNVGLPATISGGRYPFYFEAATDCRIAWFRRGDLFELLDAEPQVAVGMLMKFADWLMDVLRTNRNLAMDVPSRVANYLFGRAMAAGTPSPEGLSVPLGLYKSDLASYLNTVPETLSRAFATLSSEGLIEVHGRTIIVLDVGGLARRGEGLGEDTDAREARKKASRPRSPQNAGRS